MAIDLQRTLSELGDLLPVVPLRVSELLEAGQALHRRAEDVLERVEALPAAAEDLKDALDEVAREALHAAREAHHERQQRLEDVQAASSALTESLEEWSQELDEAAGAAHERLGTLERNFAADGKISRSEESTAGATDANGNRYRTSTEGVRRTGESHRQAHEALESRLGESARVLGEAFASASERVRELQQRALDAVAAFYEATHERQQEMASTLASTTEALQGALDTAGEELSDHLAVQQSEAARERGREACARAASAADAVHGAGQRAAGIQDLLDPLFTGVSSLLHPVEAAVDAVKAAASLAGLHLP